MKIAIERTGIIPFYKTFWVIWDTFLKKYDRDLTPEFTLVFYFLFRI